MGSHHTHISLYEFHYGHYIIMSYLATYTASWQ